MTKLSLLALCLLGLALVFYFTLVSQQPSQPNTKPQQASYLTIIESGGKYILGGHVPSAVVKHNLIKTAHEAYGGQVTDALLADSSGTPEPWLSNPGDVLPPAEPDLSDAKVEFDGERVVVSGVMTSMQKHEGYLARLREVDANLEIQDHIKIAPVSLSEPQALQADLDRTVLDHTIEFESNSDVLSANGVKLCQVIAEKLINMPSIDVEVDGYTDNVGHAATNLDLSQRRAEAVCNYLSQHGVERSRLKAQGFGQTSPVATNDTEIGRYKNRRIGFKVTGG